MAVNVITIKYSCNCYDISYSEKPNPKNDRIEKEGKRMREWHEGIAKKKSQEFIEEIRNAWRLAKNDWKIN